MFLDKENVDLQNQQSLFEQLVSREDSYQIIEELLKQQMQNSENYLKIQNTGLNKTKVYIMEHLTEGGKYRQSIRKQI